MRYNFTVRIHQDERRTCIGDIAELIVAGICLVSKPHKFGGVCQHIGNQKKFGYKMLITKKFAEVAGSHSSPMLAFKGKYLDIQIEDFPRYPVFCQDYTAARNILNGYGVNHPNNGFKYSYRVIDILNITQVL